MKLSDIHNILDGDPDVVITVDEAILWCKQAPVVKLSYYRYLVETYKGWKPKPLDLVAALWRKDTEQVVKLTILLRRTLKNRRLLKELRKDYYARLNKRGDQL